MTLLDTPAVLRIRYDGQGIECTNIIPPRIAQWDPANSQWVEVESEQNLERQEVPASITLLGIYALMGQAPEVAAASTTWPDSRNNICASAVSPPIENNEPSIYLPAVSGTIAARGCASRTNLRTFMNY